MSVHRDLIISLTAQFRIPAIYPYRYFAEAGGLVSYGVHAIDQFRRAAEYVSRILRGAKPADLPVQAPTKFELVINLKTAKALGLVIPRIPEPYSTISATRTSSTPSATPSFHPTGSATSGEISWHGSPHLKRA
jgi:ABC-type uncharacterized transport system substrate-binding protein